MNNTTRKEFTDTHYYTFQIGYCGLQNLLNCIGNYKSNSGVYGWNWNGYTLRASNGARVGITTGYRNLTGNVIPTNLADEFNKKAEEIKMRPVSYTIISKQLESLATELADTLIRL